MACLGMPYTISIIQAKVCTQVFFVFKTKLFSLLMTLIYTCPYASMYALNTHDQESEQKKMVFISRRTCSVHCNIPDVLALTFRNV